VPTGEPDEMLTVEEFGQRHGGDYVELIDGKVEWLQPGGMRNGLICARVNREFGNYVEAHDLGVACSNDTFVLIRHDPPRVRGADFACWPHDRSPPKPWPEVVPTPPLFVVEVRRPFDTIAFLVRKAFEYVDAGVSAVVVVDPEREQVCVFRANEWPERFESGDE
jgi:Uma2 family endonuclease